MGFSLVCMTHPSLQHIGCSKNARALRAHVHVLAQSCPTLCDPMDCTLQAPLSKGFSRQEYWRGLPFPPPGDLSDPGVSRVSCIGGRILYHWATWEALYEHKTCDFPSGQVPTHCQAPRPSSGFFKFLRPPTLGLGIPSQHPQTLWFCSCSRREGNKQNREVIMLKSAIRTLTRTDPAYLPRSDAIRHLHREGSVQT